MLFSPFSVIVGGIVSTIILPLVRPARVTLPAYPLEFVTKISNDAAPFMSLSVTVFVKVILLPFILDTNVLGSTVTYTYTADDDTAGNPGS